MPVVESHPVEVVFAQFLERHLCDFAYPVARSVDPLVVDDNDLPVACKLHIKLYPVGAHFVRKIKRLKSVFGKVSGCTSVRPDQGSFDEVTVFIGISALFICRCTVSRNVTVKSCSKPHKVHVSRFGIDYQRIPQLLRDLAFESCVAYRAVRLPVLEILDLAASDRYDRERALRVYHVRMRVAVQKSDDPAATCPVPAVENVAEHIAVSDLGRPVIKLCKRCIMAEYEDAPVSRK